MSDYRPRPTVRQMTAQHMQQLSEAVQRSTATIAEITRIVVANNERMAETSQQVTRTMQEITAAILRINQQIEAALRAPRKRVAVRDNEGRIIEAHDVLQ